jgi:hypothetical protein
VKLFWRSGDGRKEDKSKGVVEEALSGGLWEGRRKRKQKGTVHPV